MFSEHETDNKHIFVNAIKVDKKKESKTTPHVSTKISAYDRVVQIVTNNNNEISPARPQLGGFLLYFKTN